MLLSSNLPVFGLKKWFVHQCKVEFDYLSREIRAKTFSGTQSLLKALAGQAVNKMAELRGTLAKNESKKFVLLCDENLMQGCRTQALNSARKGPQAFGA